MSKDVKETVSSAKETLKSLENTIGKADKFRLNWHFTGGFDTKDEKFKGHAGISIVPNDNKFYYFGISGGLSDASNNNKINGSRKDKDKIKFNALLGGMLKKYEVYGGVIKSTFGFGLGYSFFEPICADFRRLKVNLNMYNFGRDKHGPEIDIGANVGLTKWLYAGIALEDVAYRRAITPYLKIEFNDKDLASLFGIGVVSCAVSALKK
jgi:hypothetical protein